MNGSSRTRDTEMELEKRTAGQLTSDKDQLGKDTLREFDVMRFSQLQEFDIETFFAPLRYVSLFFFSVTRETSEGKNIGIKKPACIK